jgi:hypothetical protein
MSIAWESPFMALEKLWLPQAATPANELQSNAPHQDKERSLQTIQEDNNTHYNSTAHLHIIVSE